MLSVGLVLALELRLDGVFEGEDSKPSVAAASIPELITPNPLVLDFCGSNCPRIGESGSIGEPG